MTGDRRSNGTWHDRMGNEKEREREREREEEAENDLISGANGNCKASMVRFIYMQTLRPYIPPTE